MPDADLPPPKDSPFRSILVAALLATLIGLLSGSASALFLTALDWVTALRWAHPGLVYGMPLAGILTLHVYQRFGAQSDRGNALILEKIHVPGGGVPRRMAPLILASTLISHLFGASVGREGTAVQMGGSLASAVAHALRLAPSRLPHLLVAGIAGGFGSVFGTPLAGAMFAIEVPTRGRFQLAAAFPALIASFVGDATCRAWGVAHTAYPLLESGHSLPPTSLSLLAKIGLAAVLFGLAGTAFVKLHHATQRSLQKHVALSWLRPCIGAGIILLLTHLLGNRDYLGLSVASPDPASVTLQTTFSAEGATPWSWLWKLLLTALSLGSGFKGGEVTPLFFIGAALGNTLATLLNAPLPLLAALGFLAVFCGSAHTPIAGALLGIELFGTDGALFFLIACLVSHWSCGSTPLYSTQRRAEDSPHQAGR